MGLTDLSGRQKVSSSDEVERVINVPLRHLATKSVGALQCKSFAAVAPNLRRLPLLGLAPVNLNVARS